MESASSVTHTGSSSTHYAVEVQPVSVPVNFPPENTMHGRIKLSAYTSPSIKFTENTISFDNAQPIWLSACATLTTDAPMLPMQFTFDRLYCPTFISVQMSTLTHTGDLRNYNGQTLTTTDSAMQVHVVSQNADIYHVGGAGILLQLSQSNAQTTIATPFSPRSVNIQGNANPSVITVTDFPEGNVLNIIGMTIFCVCNKQPTTNNLQQTIYTTIISL